MRSPSTTPRLRWIQGLLLAVGMAAVAPRAIAAPQFAAPFLSFDTGSLPQSEAIADVNGDALPDLVGGNYNASTVSVLLGTGGGSFGAKTDFATGTHPTSVAISDLNGDGRLDVVTANFGSSVSVLLGNGLGSFGPKTDIAMSS